MVAASTIFESNETNLRQNRMRKTINIHNERLPEDVYLATSDDIHGLVAQGCTVSEAIEIASDVARKMFQEQVRGASRYKGCDPLVS